MFYIQGKVTFYSCRTVEIQINNNKSQLNTTLNRKKQLSGKHKQT